MIQEDKDEEDDFELRPDDNLIIVGRTEEDGAILEVYGKSGSYGNSSRERFNWKFSFLVCNGQFGGTFFFPVRSRWEKNRFAQSLFYALFLSAFVAFFPLSFPIQPLSLKKEIDCKKEWVDGLRDRFEVKKVQLI